jgi:hypothetical protein
MKEAIMLGLRLAYWANIVILGPIGISTVFRLFPTDEGRFAESAGWRTVVGGVWTAILILSILGLLHPLRYSVVLLLQIIYKTVWLAVYAVPRLLRDDAGSVPRPMGIIFAAIVVAWPFVIPWSYLFGPGN